MNENFFYSMFYMSQGEKGDTGEPGPRGPYGLPVRPLFSFYVSTYTNTMVDFNLC